jgi:hypothetical protein
MKTQHISTAIGLGLLLSAISSQAAEQPPVIENLKPLQSLIGSWEAQFQDETFGPVQAKMTRRADTGGTTLDERWELLKDANSVWTAHVMYFWHVETKSIRYVYFASDGGHSSGILAKSTANEWIWHISGYDNEGRPTTAIGRGALEGNNKCTLRFTSQFTAGEPQPDSQLYTFKRVATAGTEKK